MLSSDSPKLSPKIILKSPSESPPKRLKNPYRKSPLLLFIIRSYIPLRLLWHVLICAIAQNRLSGDLLGQGAFRNDFRRVLHMIWKLSTRDGGEGYTSLSECRSGKGPPRPYLGPKSLKSYSFERFHWKDLEKTVRIIYSI